MTKKIIAAGLAVSASTLITASAFAAIYKPVGLKVGSTYEECSVECNEFVDSKGCRQFRKANLICTEKKKSTWPILTAQVLEKKND